MKNWLRRDGILPEEQNEKEMTKTRGSQERTPCETEWDRLFPVDWRKAVEEERKERERERERNLLPSRIRRRKNITLLLSYPLIFGIGSIADEWKSGLLASPTHLSPGSLSQSRPSFPRNEAKMADGSFLIRWPYITTCASICIAIFMLLLLFFKWPLLLQHTFGDRPLSYQSRFQHLASTRVYPS